jgi:MerR family transcriptional regulator, light-induced transcriptional regulator
MSGSHGYPATQQTSAPAHEAATASRSCSDTSGETEAARQSRVARMVELEIIPRLMLAHRTAAAATPVGSAVAIAPDDVAQFARLVLMQDDDTAMNAIDALIARDVPVERLLLELVAPTARYLGELWLQDLCNFTEVTVAAGRLQRILRELSPAIGPAPRRPLSSRRLLLLPCPGEQHTLGISMVHAFFLRAGWDVAGGAWADGAEARTWAASEWFDVAAFSLASEVRVGILRQSIDELRKESCNPALIIIVGGPLFDAKPELVAQVGADAMSSDAKTAPYLADSLVEAIPSGQASNG